MMEDRISDLLGIIRDEISLYRDLIEHARRKTALLVQGRVEAILESNKIEEAFNAKLRALEKEMARLCSDLSQSFRIPREEFTLIRLADSLEQSLALEIKTQTTLFRNIVRQLKSVNQRNMRLIERSIHYSRGLLSLIANASGSYRPTGLFEAIPSIRPTFSQRA
jgi:flagellar biosynthesis/type III secretory pathway chaperone